MPLGGKNEDPSTGSSCHDSAHVGVGCREGEPPGPVLADRDRRQVVIATDR
jgi:hypothetical protein